MNVDFRRLKIVLLSLLFSMPAYLCADKPLGDSIQQIIVVDDKDESQVTVVIYWSLEQPRKPIFGIGETRDDLSSSSDIASTFLALEKFDAQTEYYSNITKNADKMEQVGWYSAIFVKRELLAFAYIYSGKKANLEELINTYPTVRLSSSCGG